MIATSKANLTTQSSHPILTFVGIERTFNRGGDVVIGLVVLSHFAQQLLDEVEGGVFSEGRHTRGMGFMKDMEKYNNAVMLGWRIVRCTPTTLCKISTFEMIKKCIDESNFI